MIRSSWHAGAFVTVKEYPRMMARWWVLAIFATGLCSLAAKPKPAGFEVHHKPLAPRSGDTVRISAKLSVSVTNLVLQYQLVDPGGYIELGDPAYPTRWLTQAMKPERESAETVVFAADLPSALQTHRRLVRYRFEARDTHGGVTRIPAADADVPNFAYFVYDGVPAWSGAIHPQSLKPARSTPVTFGTNVMRRIQPYILIGKEKSVENVTWDEPNMGKDYKYTGTLVVEDVVYDHIAMRARGERWRYEMGKTMWKFKLSKTRRLPARDDYGRPYPVAWDKVNLRAPIQWPSFGHRGEEGMFESVGFRLFNLAGVPAPATHWVQLRIITSAEENPADQYRGDFWGLYLAIEQVDGQFLKNHALPDGNVHKMIRGGSALAHQAAGEDPADVKQFVAGYLRGSQSQNWWRARLNLPEYYSYRAICEGIHQYDISVGKNYYYYHHPADDLWMVIPWDIDLTWGDNTIGDGDEPFRQRVLSKPAFRIGYQNRVRELRDLLFNSDEAGRLIDECAAILVDPTDGPSLADADRAKWDYHPRMLHGKQAGQGRFYEIPQARNFAGMVQLMKDYVKSRGAWMDSALSNDPALASPPTLAYTGPPEFPPYQLTFSVSPYQGSFPFAALEWRLGEIRPPATRQGRPIAPGIYEITPVWESGELTNAPAPITFPSTAVTTGHTYRARVRMKDATGRWSHWSAPVQFVAGEKRT